MHEIKYVKKNYCSVCGSEGNSIYYNLVDKLFNAPGEWSFYKCGNINCNLIWLNPMPLEEDIYIAYKNYYTHTDRIENLSTLRKIYKKVQAEYLSAKFGYGKSETPFLKYFLFLDPDHLEQTKYDVMYLENNKGKILDVGCGSGIFLDFLNRNGWDTTGVDFDAGAVEYARAKKLNVKYGNVSEQNFPDNSFDVITLAHVIEHIYDPIGLLKECYRILKPNGKIIVATPNTNSLGHKNFKKYWRGLEPPRHINVFSPESLTNAVILSGFSNPSSFTSSRIARYIFNFSGEFRRINHSRNYVSRYTRFKAKLFSLFEWSLIKLGAPCGEEVILIAKKVEL